MILLDTEQIKQMVSLVETANEEIDEVVACLGQITSHNDWQCWERGKINECVDACKKDVNRLQESGTGLGRSVRMALEQICKKESEIGTWFQSVDDLVRSLIAIHAASLNTGGAGEIWNQVIQNGMGIISEDSVTQSVLMGIGTVTAVGSGENWFSNAASNLTDVNSITAPISRVDFSSLEL